MWPSVQLNPAQIATVLRLVEGGEDNIQDIYPLSPMQEGVLFHHLITPDSDPYLIQNQVVFPSRDALNRFVETLNRVIARHDALRSSAVWEGLPDPVQVVWKHAAIAVEDVTGMLRAGPVMERLLELAATPSFKIDLGRAPSMRLLAARNAYTHEWTIVWRSHHLFSDYATDAMLKEEVCRLLADPGAVLPPAAHLREFVLKARRESDGKAVTAFFTDMLRDFDEVTAPFGMADIRRGGAGIRHAQTSLDIALLEGMRDAAAKAGVSTARLLHVAWALVVSRCSGQQDAVFGTILSGRTRDGDEQLFGPLINTLPIAVRLGAIGVNDCLLETDRLLKELRRHRHASLVAAQKCSAIPAPAPLITSVLNYYRSDAAMLAAEETVPGAAIRFVQDYPLTNYPCMMTVEDFGETVKLTAQTAPGVDPLRICAMMARAIEGLVARIQAEPDKPVGTIDILPPEERELVVEGWNPTQHFSRATETVHDIFERQVALRADSVAVINGADRISYQELDERANRLANFLLGLGVMPENRVALCIRRSISTIVTLLGVLKAGGAYVPIDPGYPTGRQALILEDSAPSIILVDQSTRPIVEAALAAAQSNAMMVDLDQDDWTECPSTRPDRIESLDARCLCYILYTSGSTGRPKGVMVEHSNLVNLIYWAIEAFEPSELSRVVASTSLCFDLHAFECFAPLLAGGAVVMVENGLSLNGVEATLLNTVPSVVRELVDTGAMPVSITSLNMAGEKLSGDLVNAVFQQTSVRCVRNLYGPTETTVYSTYMTMARASGFKPGIGRPISNTDIYILDSMRNPVPLGVVGEIYIGGAGVARGYLDRPDLTADRFIESPFRRGQRIYRTGDLGSFLADGSIDLVGRNDFQIKIRGFRVELGEIEALVRADAAVIDTVVVVHDSASDDRHLICFICTTDAPAGSVEARVRQHLARALPQHLVPSAIVRLERFPTTPNGKLNRSALPIPNFPAALNRDDKAMPIGPLETEIAAVWSRILDVDGIGRHDNFFEIGGHSLHAMRVIAALRHAHMQPFTIHDIFLYPTVASLADVIMNQLVREEERI